MGDFKERFEIIFRKYAEWGRKNGFRPSKLALARFLDIPQATLQGWENRGSAPSGKALKTIHDKLGFSYDWLITGEGEMFDTQALTIAELEAENERLKTRLSIESLPETEIARAAGAE